MEEVKIIGFEQAIVELCNKTPIPWRTKYYILKDLAHRCLEASDKEYQTTMNSLNVNKTDENKPEQKGGEE